MPNRNGFTLLEICLAIFISIVLVMMAVPSVAGLLRDQRLKATFEQFDQLVQKAKEKAVKERRPYMLVWEDKGVSLEPEEMTEEEANSEKEHFSFDDGSVSFERVDASKLTIKNPPPTWTFWRSGTCEPVIIHYEGSPGKWAVQYNPLTVRAKFLESNSEMGAN